MSNDAEAKAAIEALNGKDFMGRTLNVNEARPRAEGTRGGSNRGGGFRRSFELPQRSKGHRRITAGSSADSELEGSRSPASLGIILAHFPEKVLVCERCLERKGVMWTPRFSNGFARA
jgi:RNA recognition motif-containing protein